MTKDNYRSIVICGNNGNTCGGNWQKESICVGESILASLSVTHPPHSAVWQMKMELV